MKLIKSTVYFIIIVVVTFLVAALFAPSNRRVERSISITADQKAIYQALIDVRNWYRWDAWYAADSDQERAYRGSHFDLPVGYDWQSEHNRIGSGSMRITEVKPYESLKFRTILNEEWGDQVFEGEVVLEDYHGNTKVIWFMDSRMSYPASFMNYFVDAMVGSDYESNLKGLKHYVETLPRDNLRVQETNP